MILDPGPIFLVGFMATGKSTVGRLVAERTGRVFVDLDEEIERAAGLTIPEIFQADGEAAFRRVEASALAQVATRKDIVVACGGGTPCFGDNLARMSAQGIVVALRASIGEILKRAGVDGAGISSRPLMAGAGLGVAQSMERLYAQREAVYAAADVSVDTDGREPAAVADEVARRAGRRLGAAAVRLGERSYPIHLAPLARAGELATEMIDGVTAIGLVTDENVARAGHAAAVRRALEAASLRVVEVAMPAGEAHKTLAQAGDVAAALVAGGLDRRSAVVAVGGGVVGDLAGFVASILFRGVPVAHVPTTLLAMVDSAIGGKTGVDLPAGKNLLGAFWQPRFVLADVTTLGTLPRRELLAARGEVLKYALLGDADLFAALETRDVDALDLTDLVVRCARLKADVVAKDEREQTGARAMLNLGHTIGHAIEAAALARATAPLLHGEAVALGLVAAARVSARAGVGDAALEARVAAVVTRLGLSADLTPWLGDDVLAYVKVDKKRTAGLVRFVALEAVGRPRLIDLSPTDISGFLRSR